MHERDALGGVEEMLREYCAVDQGRPRPDGAGRGAAAGARCRAPRTGSSRTSSARAISSTTRPSPDAFLVNASAWALGITARIIQPGETPEGILGQLAKRLGVPAVRAATRQAMRLMGSHFVLGADHRGGARAGRAHAAAALPLFLRHARRRRAHGRGCRPLFQFLRRRDRGDRPGRRQQSRCRTVPASRSSSRRCIRATRR